MTGLDLKGWHLTCKMRFNRLIITRFRIYEVGVDLSPAQLRSNIWTHSVCICLNIYLNLLPRHIIESRSLWYFVYVSLGKLTEFFW